MPGLEVTGTQFFQTLYLTLAENDSRWRPRCSLFSVLAVVTGLEQKHEQIHFSHLFMWTRNSLGVWSQDASMLGVVANLQSSINHRRSGLTSEGSQEWNKHPGRSWDAPGERLEDFLASGFSKPPENISLVLRFEMLTVFLNTLYLQFCVCQLQPS